MTAWSLESEIEASGRWVSRHGARGVACRIAWPGALSQNEQEEGQLGLAAGARGIARWSAWPAALQAQGAAAGAQASWPRPSEPWSLRASAARTETYRYK